MKKTIYYSIGLMVALLAGCTAEEAATSSEAEAAEGGEIRLAVAGSGGLAVTRATGATSYDYDILQEECSWPGNENYFKLTARMSANLNKVYIDDYVMYNTYVTEFPWRICELDGTQRKYYWPSSTAFDFFAYAPATSGGAYVAPSIAANGVTYDGFDEESNVHTLSCNLEGFSYGDQSGLKEFIYAYETNQTYANQGATGVTLHFQHPLSAIFLRLSSAFENMMLKTVTFTSRSAGANGIGIYHQGTGTCSTDGTAWEHLEGATASEFKFIVNKIMGQTMFIGDIFDTPFLVMPQPLVDREGLEDVVMTIKFAKGVDDGAGNISWPREKTVTLSITGVIDAWESGKAYTYSLELGKDESVIVSASVEPWNYQGAYTHTNIDEDE